MSEQPEQNESLGKKILWHLIKIPLVAMVLLVLISSMPPQVFSFSDVYNCPCYYCELARAYDSLGGLERWWVNIRVNINTIVRSIF